jgi:nucleoside-diphosphate-sugar epimerase
MRLFVTGGTGFLGSHFLEAVLAAGHTVLALRRPGSKPRIALRAEPCWVEGSLGDDWREEMRDCDALVHLAAHGVSPQKTTWDDAIEYNIRQSIVLCERAAAAGVEKQIVCGSCLEYGRIGDRYERIPANAPLEPMGIYAVSKAAFSLGFSSLATSLGIDAKLLRPFHFYGEGQDPDNFWPSLRAAAVRGRDFAMTGGEQVRDFQPVKDVAESFVSVLSENGSGGLTIRNLGSGKPVAIKDFAAKCWAEFGATGQLKVGALPYRNDEVMRLVPEI